MPRLSARDRCQPWDRSACTSPQYLIEIAGIDVVVDDDGPFAGIGTTLAGASNVQRLARMAGIALAQLDRGETCRRPGFVIPHPAHIGNAACFQRPPD